MNIDRCSLIRDEQINENNPNAIKCFCFDLVFLLRLSYPICVFSCILSYDTKSECCPPSSYSHFENVKR